MAEPPLIAALLLDAQGEFQRIVDHIPESGRREATGPLNTPAWTIVHAVSAVDAWFTDIAQGRPDEVDPFVRDFRPRQAEAGSTALDVELDDAVAVAGRVFERTAAYLRRCDTAELERSITMPGRFEDMDLTVGWLVGRSVAHLMAHAGDLSVIASLAGADDAGLPGAMPHSRAATADAGASPLTARLLLDAREALGRTIESLPEAVRAGAIEPGRLNTPGFIIAHVAQLEDRVWNEACQGMELDPWLVGAGVDFGAERSTPAFDEAVAAYRRATASSSAYIEQLSPSDLSRLITVRERETTVGARLARSAAHIWMHGGELGAIGSLGGVPDAVLPGSLPRTAGA